MVEPNSTVAWLALAAAKAAGGKLAELTLTGLVDLVAAAAEDDGFEFTPEDRKTCERLLGYRPTRFSRVWAQLRMANRRGVALVGPSGAGKTALKSVLHSKFVERSGSTTAVSNSMVSLSARVHKVADTAGRSAHGGQAYWTTFRKNPPNVLCVVVANGFLETQQDRRLRRGDVVHPNLDAYLKSTREEESEWLDVAVERLKGGPRPRRGGHVDHVVLVVNKADLWASESGSPRYERDDRFTELLATFTDLVAGPGRKAIELSVAAKFGDFQVGKRGPVNGFSEQAAEASKAYFRAAITALLSWYK